MTSSTELRKWVIGCAATWFLAAGVWVSAERPSEPATAEPVYLDLDCAHTIVIDNSASMAGKWVKEGYGRGRPAVFKDVLATYCDRFVFPGVFRPGDLISVDTFTEDAKAVKLESGEELAHKRFTRAAKLRGWVEGIDFEERATDQVRALRTEIEKVCGGEYFGDFAQRRLNVIWLLTDNIYYLRETGFSDINELYDLLDKDKRMAGVYVFPFTSQKYGMRVVLYAILVMDAADPLAADKAQRFKYIVSNVENRKGGELYPILLKPFSDTLIAIEPRSDPAAGVRFEGGVLKLGEFGEYKDVAVNLPINIVSLTKVWNVEYATLEAGVKGVTPWYVSPTRGDGGIDMEILPRELERLEASATETKHVITLKIPAYGTTLDPGSAFGPTSKVTGTLVVNVRRASLVLDEEFTHEYKLPPMDRVVENFEASIPLEVTYRKTVWFMFLDIAALVAAVALVGAVGGYFLKPVRPVVGGNVKRLRPLGRLRLPGGELRCTLGRKLVFRKDAGGEVPIVGRTEVKAQDREGQDVFHVIEYRGKRKADFGGDDKAVGGEKDIW